MFSPSRLLPFLSGLLLLALAACSGPRYTQSSAGTPLAQSPYVDPAGAPPWVDQPHSWAKLEAIGAWLEHQGKSSDPFWRNEARLELAEGRMEFAESEAGTQTAIVKRQRIGAARADFMRVQSDPDASESQLRRARRGLRQKVGQKPQLTAMLPKGVIPRASWGARPPIANRVSRASVPWSLITVHHSAGPNSLRSMASLDGAKRALRQIQTDHQGTNQWGDVGYHFFIDPSGRVFQGRSMAYQGAHAGAEGGRNHNPGNIGVCLLGNFDKERPTPASLQSLQRLLRKLQQIHRIPPNGVHAHLDWKNTACPGKHLLPHVRQYAREIER